MKILKSKFRLIVLAFAIITLGERIILSRLNQTLSNSNVHIQERLDTENFDWNNMWKSRDWNCKSYSLYIYNYHTCFIDHYGIYTFHFYKIRPYLTISRIFWPSDRSFKWITISFAGAARGKTMGTITKDGRWAICTEKIAARDAVKEGPCEKNFMLVSKEQGTWRGAQ